MNSNNIVTDEIFNNPNFKAIYNVIEKWNIFSNDNIIFAKEIFDAVYGFMKYSTFIGNRAGATLVEPDNGSLNGTIIIGDNIENLDKNQKDVYFFTDKIAIGKTLFGQPLNFKSIMEEWDSKSVEERKIFCDCTVISEAVVGTASLNDPAEFTKPFVGYQTENSMTHGVMETIVGTISKTDIVAKTISIGNYAGADLVEDELPGTVIIGDNIRNLDKDQKDVLFLGDRVVFGNYLFGKYVGLKDKIEEFVLEPEEDRL